ncbi:FAD-dependent tricarballylate dehydrogenase TcuA [Chromatium okenii]|uniref:Tricarballylate dehydrogenase n=1 Tax=Chromatium okenii TaxID=61644 RepID=A0A2S7XVK9_9GAMM|nr:FAD-dependent tricarballylate dehydrogenase TcuA [Chromatium okenii]PQJ97491.1 tricarballylate dehydrogenase [Chromatium okenii]
MTTTDILIIGGGAAALCAAIAARHSGATVLLCEQAPRSLRGGNTRHSRNLRIMHETITPLSTGRYPAYEFLADLDRASAGNSNADLARLLVYESADITAWLAGAGVQFQPVADGRLPPSRKTAFLLGGGTAMINALYATAEQLGVIIRYASEISALQLDGERVIQVQIKSGSATHTLTPRAVIAACGGAQANRDWWRTTWGAAADGLINRGTPFATGAVLNMLLDQGVQAVGDPTRAYLVAVDARSPADDGGIVTRIRCMPAGIVVDANGQRFHDEGGDTASTRYAIWGQRLAQCPGQIAYLLLDARGMRNAPPSLYSPCTAPDLSTLAEQLNIPTPALQATVAAYHAAICPPIDAQQLAHWHTVGLEPPKSHHALPLIEPPFGAYPMRPGITFTYHGVGVDAQMRVTLRNGSVMNNLFAAGMLMAPNIFSSGYVSGLALTISCVSGRLAGQAAALHVQG